MAAKRLRILVISTVKNEGPFLVEWIAWHRMIGVTDFLFFSNDCTDGTDLLLNRLAELGIVRHAPNPAKGKSSYIVAALRRALATKMYRKADWVYVTDADEFPDITVGSGTLPDLIEATKQPHAISLSMVPFGAAGIETFEDRPVSQQFFWRRPIGPDADAMRLHTKVMFQTILDIGRLGAHRPYLKSAFGVDWRDGSGNPVPQAYLRAEARNRMLFEARHSTSFAKLNHYSLRSLESYLVKVDRGDAANSPLSDDRQFGLEYWTKCDSCEVQDTGLTRFAPRLADEMAGLLADAQVAELHQRAVLLHRQKAALLLEQPRYQDLRAQISATMQRPDRGKTLVA